MGRQEIFPFLPHQPVVDDKQCVCLFVGVLSHKPLGAGLPMTHGLRVFDALEPKFNPFKFDLRVELTL